MLGKGVTPAVTTMMPLPIQCPWLLPCLLPLLPVLAASWVWLPELLAMLRLPPILPLHSTCSTMQLFLFTCLEFLCALGMCAMLAVHPNEVILRSLSLRTTQSQHNSTSHEPIVLPLPNPLLVRHMLLHKAKSQEETASF